MPRGEERDLAFDAEVFGVEPGEVVERVMHECHVGVPVAEQPCLLADLAQKDLNRGRTRFARRRVKEPSQQLVGRSGLRREHCLNLFTALCQALAGTPWIPLPSSRP
nr:hypothetical protein [Frankia gtarii]